MNIQAQIVEERIHGGQRRHLPALLQISGKVKALIHAEPRHKNIAGKLRGFGRSGIAQAGIRGGTHARRIAQPNVLSCGRKVKVETVAVGEKAANIQFAAAGPRCELLNLYTVLGEHHCSVDLAKAVGQIGKRNSGINQIKPAGGLRPRDGPAYVDGKSRRPIRDDVRVVTLQQFQVEAALGVQIESVVSSHLDAALDESICIFTNQVELLQMGNLSIHGETDRAIILPAFTFSSSAESWLASPVITRSRGRLNGP